MSKRENFAIKNKNGFLLRGMVHYFGEISNCKPVIIVHGYFSANRNGPHRLFVKIGDELANRGFAVFRFDLSGMGESDGKIDQINFKNHVDDVLSVVEYAKQKCNSDAISLIAHSLGCAVVLEVMKDHYKTFNKAFFLAPFFSSDKTIKQMLGIDNLDELEKMVPIYRKGLYSDISYFKESSVDSEFVPELNSAVSNKVAICVVLAKKDQYINIEEARELFNQVNGISVVEIDNADHNFLETQKQVIDLLADKLS